MESKNFNKLVNKTKEADSESNLVATSREREAQGQYKGSAFVLCALSCSVVSDSCDPIDGSLPGSSVHWILQARIPEWVAVSFSRESSHPGIKPRSPALQSESLATEL